jgi:hypothetical protein
MEFPFDPNEKTDSGYGMDPQSRTRTPRSRACAAIREETAPACRDLRRRTHGTPIPGETVRQKGSRRPDNRNLDPRLVVESAAYQNT